MRRAFRAHPGSESFVEPEIVPPSHGHEITKPLMRDLVCKHFIDILLGLGRRVFRVKQKRGFVISNAAPVFHGAAEPTG